MNAPLEIGVARCDITPPTGIPMVGFAGRGPATDVHDPLKATALAARCGDTTAVLLNADLLQLRAETVADIRRSVHAATGIPADHITLSCTHNHYGPDVDRAQDAIVSAYRENLRHLFAGIAREAAENLRPAKFGIGWGASDIGINRREKRPDGVVILGQNPAGPVDRSVGVVRIENADGKPLATLVNFACHPVSQGGGMRSLSADFPGRARDIAENMTGAPCFYLQGACGDVNPIRMEHAYEPARTLGVRLGCEVVRIWETIATEEATGLGVASETVSLPRYRYDSRENAERLVAELDAQIAALEAQGRQNGAAWWAKLRRTRAGEAVESWKTGQSLPEVAAELQAWRLGNLAFATAPAEIFTMNGRHVKEHSPFERTFFVAYTNGSIGYVPTRDAYPDGGYEVTHACQVDPDAGDLVNEGCLRLLGRLARQPAD